MDWSVISSDMSKHLKSTYGIGVTALALVNRIDALQGAQRFAVVALRHEEFGTLG